MSTEEHTNEVTASLQMPLFDNNLPIISRYVYLQFAGIADSDTNPEQKEVIERQINFSFNVHLHRYITSLILQIPHQTFDGDFQKIILQKPPKNIHMYRNVPHEILIDEDLLEVYDYLLTLYALFDMQSELNGEKYSKQMQLLPGNRTDTGLPYISNELIEFLPTDLNDEENFESYLASAKSHKRCELNAEMLDNLFYSFKITGNPNLQSFITISYSLLNALELQANFNQTSEGSKRNTLAFFSKYMCDKSNLMDHISKMVSPSQTEKKTLNNYNKRITFLLGEVANEPYADALFDYFFVALKDNVIGYKLLYTFGEILALSNEVLERYSSDDNNRNLLFPEISPVQIQQVANDEERKFRSQNQQMIMSNVRRERDEFINIEIEAKYNAIMNFSPYLRYFLMEKFEHIHLETNSEDAMFLELKLLNLAIMFYQIPYET